MSSADLLVRLGMISVDINRYHFISKRRNRTTIFGKTSLGQQHGVTAASSHSRGRWTSHPWRGQLRCLLKTRREWDIVGEASDGQEAIEKARDLQPDIILLDIGMPYLNGIEAAKIIYKSCPKSKILFLTQESDSDIRIAAMRAGAARYLLKANAVHELLEAIASALGSPQLAASSANSQ